MEPDAEDPAGPVSVEWGLAVEVVYDECGAVVRVGLFWGELTERLWHRACPVVVADDRELEHFG